MPISIETAGPGIEIENMFSNSTNLSLEGWDLSALSISDDFNWN